MISYTFYRYLCDREHVDSSFFFFKIIHIHGCPNQQHICYGVSIDINRAHHTAKIRANLKWHNHCYQTGHGSHYFVRNLCEQCTTLKTCETIITKIQIKICYKVYFKSRFFFFSTKRINTPLCKLSIKMQHLPALLFESQWWLSCHSHQPDKPQLCQYNWNGEHQQQNRLSFPWKEQRENNLKVQIIVIRA